MCTYSAGKDTCQGAKKNFSTHNYFVNDQLINFNSRSNCLKAILAVPSTTKTPILADILP